MGQDDMPLSCFHIRCGKVKHLSHFTTCEREENHAKKVKVYEGFHNHFFMTFPLDWSSNVLNIASFASLFSLNVNLLRFLHPVHS